jgi:hypothetical protein
MIYGGQVALARVYQGRAQEVIEMLEQSVSAYPATANLRSVQTRLADPVALVDVDIDAVARGTRVRG